MWSSTYQLCPLLLPEAKQLSFYHASLWSGVPYTPTPQRPCLPRHWGLSEESSFTVCTQTSYHTELQTGKKKRYHFRLCQIPLNCGARPAPLRQTPHASSSLLQTASSTEGGQDDLTPRFSNKNNKKTILYLRASEAENSQPERTLCISAG